MRFVTEQIIAGIPYADYEALFFDEALNEAICVDLELERTLVARDLRDGVLARTVRVRPRRRVPLALRRLVDAAGVADTETMHYTFGSGEAHGNVVPERLAERASARGTVLFTDTPTGCRRRVAGEVTIHIPALGGMAERLIAADIERSFSRAAEFTSRWWAARQ